MVILIHSCVSCKCYCINKEDLTAQDIKDHLYRTESIPPETQLITQNGLYLSNTSVIKNDQVVRMVLSLPGGKGGFGSMLRAIGAQIEKTTNREACRDLSGRRLRDINEEKRLKQWITKQSDRETETKKRKQEKLERKRAAPKHQFNDVQYDKERSELTEKMGSSLEEGLKKSLLKPVEDKKRKVPDDKISTKKPCMWLGLDGDINDSDLSSDESENESKIEAKTIEIEKNVEINETEELAAIDLTSFNSMEDLEKLGEERLAALLKNLGMKSGGNLSDKAERLWAICNKETKKVDISKLNMSKVVPESCESAASS